MPFYASAEQIMRDRSEYARKNVARGRGVVVLKYPGGILFVAENPSNTLHKLGEIYDRVGFAAAGRYNEYENLRVAGVRYADLRGYSNSRRDVSGRAVANAFAQTLGAIFTEQQKPYEVEICVAEVGDAPAGDQLYRLTYDGSIVEEPQLVAMGGHADTIESTVRDTYHDSMSLAEATQAAVRALSAAGDTPRELGAANLEVATLDRDRTPRAFHRLIGPALNELLAEPSGPDHDADADADDDAGDADIDGAATDDSATGDEQTSGDESSERPDRGTP